ncbi:MAG: hypothetical protein ACE5JR_09275 [Gemmatimonadota bacterium]
MSYATLVPSCSEEVVELVAKLDGEDDWDDEEFDDEDLDDDDFDDEEWEDLDDFDEWEEYEELEEEESFHPRRAGGEEDW